MSQAIRIVGDRKCVAFDDVRGVVGVEVDGKDCDVGRAAEGLAKECAPDIRRGRTKVLEVRLLNRVCCSYFL